jgi:hypothetical protein
VLEVICAMQRKSLPGAVKWGVKEEEDPANLATIDLLIPCTLACGRQRSRRSASSAVAGGGAPVQWAAAPQRAGGRPAQQDGRRPPISMITVTDPALAGPSLPSRQCRSPPMAGVLR